MEKKSIISAEATKNLGAIDPASLVETNPDAKAKEILENEEKFKELVKRVKEETKETGKAENDDAEEARILRIMEKAVEDDKKSKEVVNKTHDQVN
jgi:hypothetical protein